MNLPKAPERSAFKTQAEFEEAMGYWQSGVGRIMGMRRFAKPMAPSEGSLETSADSAPALSPLPKT
jgi:hypothetical protein